MKRRRFKVIDGGGGTGAAADGPGSGGKSAGRKVEHRGGDQIGDKLTAKQEAFVRNILAGQNQSDAYRNAGYSSKLQPKSVWTAASMLFANEKVSRRITAGKAQQERSATHSAASLRVSLIKQLAHLAEHAVKESDRLRAMDILGRTEYVKLFLERTADMTPENLSEEEVLEQLKDKLKRAFG